MDTPFSTNRKFKRMLANILSIFVTRAIAFPVTGSASAQETAPTEGWQQVNVSGFGDPQTSGAISLGVFHGQLYAGAYNGNADGRVWRLVSGCP